MSVANIVITFFTESYQYESILQQNIGNNVSKLLNMKILSNYSLK